MKITLLGTGTPAPLLKRVCSGYLIEVGSDLIVMDHGAGAHQRLLETGRRATEVTHVFLSHLHYDHCMDFPRLVLQRWDMAAGKAPELKVFGPPPLKRLTENLFGPEGFFGPDVIARTNHRLSLDIYEGRGGTLPRRGPMPEVTEVRHGSVVEGNCWRVRVADVSHVQPYLECHGFRLDTPQGSMCYSGDSGGVPKHLVDLAEGVDILIHMCHFMSGTEPNETYRATCGGHRDAAEVARRAGAKTLVLTHILPGIDHPRIREQILREVMEIFPGEVIWGEDLMEIPVQPLPRPKIG
jgi:ribonuclease BN (tRNA processing enzyme)